MKDDGPRKDRLRLNSVRLPVEIELYVNPDGSVTFADLEASLVQIAQQLNPAVSSKRSMPPGEVETTHR